ncbi:MAG: TlyA family RNA methyltransferase [Candidatus Saccharimonadales bacterium]
MKKRLDQLIADKGLVNSRNKAQAVIMAGQVMVDGKVVTKPGTPTKEDSKIKIKELPKYVSRGGEKLESAVKNFNIKFLNKTVLDVGSSTGGFTDFALQNGAKKVYAVDVGTNQLDYKLRQDKRVEVMEKTDIRSVKNLASCSEIVVIDVSFISIRKVLPVTEQHLCANGQIIAMVKPQFEASKKEADLNKGVIKNDKIRRKVLKDFEEWSKERYVIVDKADSSLAGQKGNIERFYLLKPIKKN